MVGCCIGGDGANGTDDIENEARDEADNRPSGPPHAKHKSESLYDVRWISRPHYYGIGSCHHGPQQTTENGTGN